MEIGKTMPQHNSEKEPTTFFNIAACFSKEEWALLYEWQQEIYTNVMKEIHEALASLGPRIATCVFSIKAKEDGDPKVPNHQGFQEKTGLNSSRIVTFDTNVLPRKESNLWPSIVDSAHTERGDHSTDSLADSDYGVVKVTIKEEEEDQQPMEQQEFKGTETTDCLAGFEANKGVIGEENSIIFTKKQTLFDASSRKRNYLQCSAKEEDAGNSVWQESNLEEQTKVATKPASDLLTDTLLITGSEKVSALDSNLCNTTFFKLPSNTEQTHDAYPCTQLTAQEMHIREKLYDCTECDKKFSLKRHLIMHQKSHKEQREQPFQCIQCQKSFSEKCNLVIHMRTHTGERPFQCTLCEKRFSIKSNLVKHQILHPRECPAKVVKARNLLLQENNLEGQTKAVSKHELNQDVLLLEESGKTSVSESNLWNITFFTLPRNEPQTGGAYTCTALAAQTDMHSKDKPYPCAVCEKRFSVKRNLIRHQRTHKEQRERPFQCVQCHKSFSEKCNLVIHMRTHTGERPFQCTQCEKRFSIKANLVTHQRLHSRERPYQCSECEKSFNQKSHLISHMTKHT